MGRYSLDSYCSYETYKIRPRPLVEGPERLARGTFQLLEYTWKELEPERGRFCLEYMTQELSSTRNPILKLSKQAPDWVNEERLAKEGFAHLVRRVGSTVAPLHRAVGALITSSSYDIGEIDAYFDAFGPMPLLVSLEDTALIIRLKEMDKEFGLLVPCSEVKWIDCCEYFAKLGLQNIWMQKPVVLQIEDQEPGPYIRRQSSYWHAGLANLPMDIGYTYTLRRLTYPKRITSGGGLPLRFWFVNTGSAPCYQEFSLILRLSREGLAKDFRLNTDTKRWLPGDIVHNEIVLVPELVDGTYQVSIGLLCFDGTLMQLNIEGKQNDGFYQLGYIDVASGLEDNLLHAWDDFYPDGYYPLEDPGSPKES